MPDVMEECVRDMCLEVLLLSCLFTVGKVPGGVQRLLSVVVAGPMSLFECAAHDRGSHLYGFVQGLAISHCTHGCRTCWRRRTQERRSSSLLLVLLRVKVMVDKQWLQVRT